MEVEVVAGSYDCAIRGLSFDVLAPGEKSLRPKFHGCDHSGSVRTVASGGKYLATGSTDETIKLYDMKEHKDVGTLLQHEGSITWLTFHENTHLFSASEDKTVCIWQCGTWKHLHTLAGHRSAVTCVSVHPSGKFALTVGKDRTLRTWNLVTGQQAYSKRLREAAVLVQWSPIGDQYALAFQKCIAIHAVQETDTEFSADIGKRINCMLYVKDGVLAVASEHSFIQLFSTSSMQCLTELKGHASRVKGLAMSAGGELLFSASSDGAIKTWRIHEPLDESLCVCSVETGSRLTCLTAVLPESLRKELRHGKKKTVTIKKEDSEEIDTDVQKGDDKKKTRKNGKRGLRSGEGLTVVDAKEESVQQEKGSEDSDAHEAETNRKEKTSKKRKGRRFTYGEEMTAVDGGKEFATRVPDEKDSEESDAHEAQRDETMKQRKKRRRKSITLVSEDYTVVDGSAAQEKVTRRKKRKGEKAAKDGVKQQQQKRRRHPRRGGDE